jgi:predicted  nucleic acid-binding Zn-ribbon protein
VNKNLEGLIALQRVDTEADDASRKLADEPKRQQAFEARLEAARRHVNDAKARLTESQNARRVIEKEVAVHQGRLSKFRDQLMAVKTNVEYQAMQKEIEFAQKEIKGLEDTILERMLEGDDLAAGLKKAESELAAEQKAVDAEKRALSTELAQLQTTVERLTAERKTLVSSVDPKVLATFEAVSRRRHGIGMALARDGICTICHVRLRPQVFNTILRNEEILQCDSCGRILYYVPGPPASAGASPSAP